MISLAWRNLFHDRVRLVVTLVGIVFALVLILVQFGLFLGFLDTSANIVAASGADLWVSAPDIPHVNGGAIFNESKRYQALETPGVAKVEKWALLFMPWKLPSGAQESVQVVGFDLNGGMGGPWNLTKGSIDALRGDDTVIIDELYAPMLGVKEVGDTVEIADHRARVVGFTRGIRSFTTIPYVFCNFKNAQNYTQLAQQQTMFLLIRTQKGADLSQVQADLKTRLEGVDVFTNAQMLKKTQNYWVFSTGAGVSTLMGSVLGLIVGIVVVAQTIYSATIDHIREFGTLKAIGASNSKIYTVILTQAAISATLGYLMAIVIATFVSNSSQNSNAPILLPGNVAVGTFFLALAMCAGASILSIRKATKIDPAMVFRG